jgi:hypothetical protein
MSSPMARVEAQEFGERETRLVFIARNVGEAERVEELLSEHGVDFFVQLERYVSGLLFATERAGIGFHVLEAQAVWSRTLLVRRFKSGVVEEPKE